MLIEAFLTKIATAVFTKAILPQGLAVLAGAYEIYSLVEDIAGMANCVDSANDCAELGVCALHVASGPLSDVVASRLLEVGCHTFTVDKTRSGIYIASTLVRPFRIPSLGARALTISAGAGGIYSPRPLRVRPERWR
jgi:hypothetical protein